MMLQDAWQLFLARQDFFLGLLLEHLQISLIVVFLSIVFGVFIGVLITEFAFLRKTVLSIINFVYTIPSIAMLGFLIPFSGIGNTTAIIALVIYGLLPMVRNTYTGIMSIDKGILEAATSMGITKLQILLKIKLPLAFDIIMSGIRNMVTMSIALTGIASFIGAGGLGVAIYRGITTNNSSMVIVGSLLIAFLALFMDYLQGLFEKRLQKKDEKNRKINIVLGSLALVVIVLIAGSIFVKPNSKNVIHIATKPMTEQYIIGEMLDILIEKTTGLEVELNQGIGGGTSNIHPAMLSEEFDLYPEYTGTGWNIVLKHDTFYTEKLFNILKKEYLNKFDMQWIGKYGFNNTYGIAVRKEIAEKYNLKSYSDLSKVSDLLIFGAEYDFFEREDGYKGLCDAYKMKFKETMDLDIGLKYEAMKQNKIDVMTIFTTDGQLSNANVVVLKDDKEFYPSYFCMNIIRSEILIKYPQLKDVIMSLNNTINNKDMSQMNYEVESEAKRPRDVAYEYLKKKGILKE